MSEKSSVPQVLTEYMMKLTDNEIRDITKYLGGGRPLLDAYRFLLFEKNARIYFRAIQNLAFQNDK